MNRILFLLAAAASTLAPHAFAAATPNLCAQNTALSHVSFSIRFEQSPAENFDVAFQDCVLEDETLGEPMTPRTSRLYFLPGQNHGLVITTDENSAESYLALLEKTSQSRWRTATGLGKISNWTLLKTGATFSEIVLPSGSKTTVTVSRSVPQKDASGT